MDGFSLPDSSLDGFSARTADKAKVITLARCSKCGAYSNEPEGSCCRSERLLPPAPPLLMPPSPLEHHTQYTDEEDDMWGHLLGGG